MDVDEVSELIPYVASNATVNVYAVPFVNPVTDIELHGAEQVPLIELGLDVARYVPVPDFPRYVDSVKATVAEPSPAVAVPMVGVVGFLP